MAVTAYLGLGSNLGDRMAALQRARALLLPRGFRTVGQSSVYETAPVGGPPQGPYLNEVLAGETELSPEALLAACLATEQDLLRVRGERFGPRTLDVDILFYGDERRRLPGLVVPHPRLPERRFVLVPLNEIAPALRHPVLELTVAEMLARCPDHSEVRLYERAGAHA